MAGQIKLSYPQTKGFWEVPVLYEDEALFILDKPAGLSIGHEEGCQDPDLIEILHKAIHEGKPWVGEHRVSFLRPAHRIDANASGILIFAKAPESLAALANAFGSEQVRRQYLALIQGSPVGNQFDVQGKIAPHPETPGLMRIDPRNGKKSHTQFEVVERFSHWTVLGCVSEPDRLHQVRLHLRYAQFPVVGDSLYRGGILRLSSIKPNFRLKPKDTERPLMNRPAVHLEKIQLKHPLTGAPLEITAPLPKDISVALKYLRKYAGTGLA
jgi:RluA family pseudouridine synthase